MPHQKSPALSSNQQKYLSRNPLKAHFVRQFTNEILGLVEAAGPASLLEVGCGEGFVLSAIEECFSVDPLVGIDVDQPALDQARLFCGRASLLRMSAERLCFADDQFEAVICLEVFEHLNHPMAALQEICRVTRQEVILSVPNEPWFRLGNFLCLSHFSRLGNPPGHINHWSARQFTELVRPYLKVRASLTSGFWTIVAGSVR